MADLADVGTKRYDHPAQKAEETELFFEMLDDLLEQISEALKLLREEASAAYCIAREALTVTNAAVMNLNRGRVSVADYCEIQVETNQIRYEVEAATDPTTTTGKILNPPNGLRITGQVDMEEFGMIASGSNATVWAYYFKKD